MRKFIQRYYSLFIVILLFTYSLLIRCLNDVYTSNLSIALIIGAVFIPVIAFLLNKSVIKTTRIFYLVALISCSVFFLSEAAYLFWFKQLYQSLGYKFAFVFPFSLSLSCTLFLVFYTVMNFFNKDYSIQSFDFQNFKMCLNSLAYIAVAVIFSNPFNVLTFYPESNYLIIPFDGYMIGVIITFGVYLIGYFVIDIFQHKFLKEHEIKK